MDMVSYVVLYYTVRIVVRKLSLQSDFSRVVELLRLDFQFLDFWSRGKFLRENYRSGAVL